MFVKNSCDGKFNNSVDIRFIKACDNHCSFCIEKTGVPFKGNDIKEMIKSTLATDRKEVLILGGEPFLSMKKLNEYIDGIREHKEKIFITTALPKTIIFDYKLFEEIVNKIDGLNISIHHYNDKVNTYVLQSPIPHNRINLLKKILFDKQKAKKVRVSVNLVKGFIDNKETLEHTIRLLQHWGCQHLKINELQMSSENYVSFEKIMGRKLRSPYAYGCQTIIQQKPMKITLKRSCFWVEPSLDASVSDLLKVIFNSLKNKIIKPKFDGHKVIYENGEISDGWQSI